MAWVRSILLHARILCLAGYSLEELSRADHSIGMKLAVEDGPPDLVRDLLREYLEVQKVDPNELWTARTNIFHYADFPILHYACMLPDREEEVGVLLEAGAPADYEADSGMRPLHSAAEHGSAGAVKLLLRAGVNPRQPASERAVNNNDARKTGFDGMTAATLAAKHGHVEVLRALLDSGGAAAGTLTERDGNMEVGAYGWAPIQYAVHHRLRAVTDFLTFEVGWGSIGAADVLRAAPSEDRGELDPVSEAFAARRDQYLKEQARKTGGEL
mmetsp:Transcript_30425/g.95920  ORF Transcript_30425/g.95920 Transcript_30425/m.95920 type:complete len:271 (-) Transcript_30425:52-864(-)